jgi:hypothetical protein
LVATRYFGSDCCGLVLGATSSAHGTFVSLPD